VKKSRSIKRSTIQQAARHLNRFLDDPQVKRFLKELCGRGQHILICTDYEDGGFGTAYFLDRAWLRASIEPMGTWVMYSKNLPSPKMRSCTSQEIAAAYARLVGDPRRIVGNIRRELERRFARALSSA
jgi:hypothetical protein